MPNSPSPFVPYAEVIPCPSSFLLFCRGTPSTVTSSCSAVCLPCLCLLCRVFGPFVPPSSSLQSAAIAELDLGHPLRCALRTRPTSCFSSSSLSRRCSLSGTGDHTFERRLRLGGPLVKENIATMVLESPFYGQRHLMLQRGAKLLCVSDLLLLGRATIEEARNLLNWLDEAGFGKMGVCGLGMGGVHATMVGSLHPTPVATFPFLSPHSAVVAFYEGILKHGTAWEALREDLAAQKVAMTLEEVRERMRNVLSLIDVTRFPIPKKPSAVIFVAATDDGYIPKHSVLELQKAWPGSEVRWVTCGHVSSFLLHNGKFGRAIVDGLDRLPWKESPL